MISDSSDDDSQVEDNLTGKNTNKSEPCKMTLSPNYVPHATYGNLCSCSSLYSRFLWCVRSFLCSPFVHLTHINSDDSSDESDDSQEAVPQVAKSLESQRDSSKTLSSADDVESDESTDETGSDSSDESKVDTDSNSVPTSKKSGKKVARAKKSATSSPDVSSSSSSDSDSEEEDELPSVSKHKTKSTSSSDSSSSSSSDSDSDEMTNVSKHKTKSTSSSDSSSISDSDSDSDQNSKPAATNKLKRKAASSSDSDSSSEDDTSETSSSSSSSESSSSQSEDELEGTPSLSVKPDPETRVTKKRRANEEGKAVVIATTSTVTTRVGNTREGKASRKPNTPFQRVKVEVEYNDGRLKDNSFESRVRPLSRVLLNETGSEYIVIAQGARPDDYGARANRDLVVTRGDGFRKEKNKKKRGSYRGGDITVGLILSLGYRGKAC